MLELEKEDKIRLKKGEKAAKYSSVINLLLAIIKGIVGFLSGSIVLIADSIHSFSDIIASLAVYVGIKLSMRKPDEKFPYGYYKIETFASLLVSAIIIITGIEIALESYNAFLNPTVIGIPFIAIFVAAFSALVSFLLAKYKNDVGTRIGSQALISDGKHSFIDIFSSIIVFIGILSSYLGYVRIQGISGVLVAFLIIYIGLKLAKNDILVLLDANLDPKTINEIKFIAESIDRVEGVHNIKVRRSGPFIFAELHLETKKGLSVKKASEITKNVQSAVKDRIKNLDNLSVQIEPFKKGKLRVAVPVENKKGLQSKISEHLAKAAYILIVDVVSGKITDIVIKENPGTKVEKKKGIETAEFLAKENVDILVANEVGEGPSYVLSDKLIDITIPQGRNLDEIIINATT